MAEKIEKDVTLILVSFVWEINQENIKKKKKEIDEIIQTKKRRKKKEKGNQIGNKKEKRKKKKGLFLFLKLRKKMI